MSANFLRPSLLICLVLMGAILILIDPGFSVFSQTSKKQGVTQEQPPKFGGTYSTLKPAQRRLVDELYRQYNELTKNNLNPAEDYNELSLSVRTTFEAVTHALMTSKLTDQNGRSLGTALDLVSYLETVHGKLPASASDLQFRIYVALKPNAMQTLENSREFKRGRDNTQYHKGYLINYRQQGGVPSIQISCSEDGKRADIDVDYRSSKIPAALVNGHLKSANSDVRAGDNYDRHINRWSGFANWWKSIFGVPLNDADLKDEDLVGKRDSIPPIPRAGKGKPWEAMFDFLNSWLVEQQPNEAVAYISTRAYSCIDQVASDEKKKINPGLIPFYILGQMKKVNHTIGKPAGLAVVAQSVRPNDPALKQIDQPHSAEFALFETPDDIAFDFECANRNVQNVTGETKKQKRKYGNYYGASLRVKESETKGATLLILWTKESDYWKIISWNVEPDNLARKEAPNTLTKPAGAETKLDRVTGDSALISTVQEFFEEWFVKQNFERAIEYFSSQCYPCVNLYLGQGEKMTRNWPEGKNRLIYGMKKVSNQIGRKSDVEEAMKSITPVHPSLKLVSHTHEEAYTLVSVPGEIAAAFECTSQATNLRRRVKAAQKSGGPAVYGNYYGAMFELRVGGAPASLNILWGKEKGQWKIIAYSIEVP
jgi:hypothetical protein